MSEDEKMQELSRLREKALHEEATALSAARNEVHEEARAEGRAEERDVLISLMRESGIPEEQIQMILSDR